MSKLIIKLEIIWKIITNQYKHFVVLNLQSKELVNMFSDKDFDIDVMYCGVRPYVIHKIIKEYAKVKDDIDMMLDKIQFEEEALLNKQNKQ